MTEKIPPKSSSRGSEEVLMAPTAPSSEAVLPSSPAETAAVTLQVQAAASYGQTSETKTGQYVRTQSLADNVYDRDQQKQIHTGSWITSKVASTHRLSLVTKSKTGTTTPDFHRRVKLGEILPVNPFSNKTITQEFNYRKFNSKIWYINDEFHSEITGEGPYRDPSLPEATGAGMMPTTKQMQILDAKAIQKLRLRLKDQKVNVAMIVAERNKTALGLAKIVKTIADMVIALRAGNIRKAAEAAGAHVGYRKTRTWKRDFARDSSKAVSNGWLELQYAIKPLLMDAKGLAEALAQHQYRKITGVATAEAYLNVDNKTVAPNGQVTHNLGNVSIRYAVYYQVDLPEMPSLAGLGLLNPPQLAWELIPFSFVVDWFIPIGDWLSSLDATVGLSFSDGAKSVRVELSQEVKRVNRSFTVRPMRFGNYQELIFQEDVSSYYEDSVTRTKLSSFPAAQLPSFEDPYSLTRFFSALALLRKQARF